jgi:hypothetical protein
VEAITTPNQNGDVFVTFVVAFDNIGKDSIYVTGGCGGGLYSSVENSSIIEKIPGGLLCECPALIMELKTGQNHSSFNPGCWSGYAYRFVRQGTVVVDFTLYWSPSGQTAFNANSTSIVAKFNLA